MGYSRDPYDIRVAFDDVYGEEPPARVDDVAETAHAIVQRAASRRLAPRPPRVVAGAYEPKYLSTDIANVSYQIIGAYEPKYLSADIADVSYQIVGETPIFSDLKRRFAVAMPPPTPVRVDTEQTYADFRDIRRQPYIQRLEARLAALEDAVARHTADNHGNGRLAALEDRFEQHLREGHGADVLGAEAAVDDAVREAAQGGTRVPLSLPSWANGKIECWQDGPAILCTIRLLGCDGRPRLATAAAPVAPHLDEVLGCASVVGADPEVTMAVAPHVAQSLCGRFLLGHLCGAAPELIRRAGRGTFIGTLVSDSDPTMAAAMALLQRCQRDERAACRELRMLVSAGQGALFAEAAKRLQRGQREKMKGWN